MKIYNLDKEDMVYCFVKPGMEKHVRYVGDQGRFELVVSTNNNYDESELTTKISSAARDFIFWMLFVAYNNPRYHDEHNSEVFETFIKVLS